MNRSGSMSLQQHAMVKQLKSEQFAVVREENKVVVLQRGNDFRLVQRDGTQKRAFGAKP